MATEPPTPKDDVEPVIHHIDPDNRERCWCGTPWPCPTFLLSIAPLRRAQEAIDLTDVQGAY